MTCTLRLLTFVGFCLAVGQWAHAAPITFGSGTNQFNIEFVEIGAPGNAADTTGNPTNPPHLTGAVPYVFHMGKFEVSRDMITKANNLGGLAITMSDMSSFVTGGARDAMPATGVSWNEAARFINWLNTSQGYAPAYKFALQPGDVGYSANAHIEPWTISDPGYDSSNPFRNSQAQYFLPSVDEWYKAAYYDPDSGLYGVYPTSDGTIPTAVANGTTDLTAVFNQSFSQGPADIMAAGGLSAFGVMGLGGNVWEWEETEFDLLNDVVSSARGIRGGSWVGDSGVLASSVRNNGNPVSEVNNFGFRVASLSSDAVVVPEPNFLAVWTLAAVSALWWCRRLKK